MRFCEQTKCPPPPKTSSLYPRSVSPLRFHADAEKKGSSTAWARRLGFSTARCFCFSGELYGRCSLTACLLGARLLGARLLPLGSAPQRSALLGSLNARTAPQRSVPHRSAPHRSALIARLLGSSSLGSSSVGSSSVGSHCSTPHRSTPRRWLVSLRSSSGLFLVSLFSSSICSCHFALEPCRERATIPIG